MKYLAFSLIISTGLICATYLALHGQECIAFLILLIIGTSSFIEEKKEK